jgi:cell division protein FtsB
MMIRIDPALDLLGPLRLPPRRRQNPWLRRALVFCSCVLLLDALFGDRGLAQTMKAREAFRRASQDLVSLKRENAALHDEVRRLREDPATLEAVARANLGLIRRGEILVILKDVR